MTNIAVKLYDEPAPPDGRMRILLLKLGERIGDIVVSLDAFQMIRDGFPDAHITLICPPGLVEFAAATGLFDRVAGFAHLHDVMAERAVPRLDGADQDVAFATLLDGPYFLAADFRHDGSTRRWLDRVEARYRAGFAAATAAGLDIALPEMEWDVRPADLSRAERPPQAGTRLVLLAHSMVNALAPSSHAARRRFVWPQRASALAARLAAESQRKIGMCLGAGSALRQWPMDYWASLLRQLAGEGFALVMLGGKEDGEPSAALAAQLPAGACLDLIGQILLSDLPQVMRALDLYIGCDTGLTHLAAQLGLPTVNIFAGISTVPVWRAAGDRVKTVYAAVPCAPCHLRLASDCRHGQVCMKAIAPGIVYDCIQQLMANG